MVDPTLDLPAALRARGLRMTPQRQLILEAITSLSGHISADAVHRRVVEQFPNVNISTVYRTLEVLQDLGVVNHTHFHDGVAQYHLASEGLHQHLVCRECGSARELDVRVVQPLAETLKQEYGFEADIAHFAIVGLCAGCSHKGGQTSHSHGA